MYIKTVAFGNSSEAFVENRLTEGFNIIYSQDDNNKGKTILIQSMMYALGNEPIFPESFPFKEYYHVCIVESDGVEYTILRKGKEYLVRYGDVLEQYSNTTEFKDFLSSTFSIYRCYQLMEKINSFILICSIKCFSSVKIRGTVLI